MLTLGCGNDPAPEVAEFALGKPAGGLTVEEEVGREG
jgi:hypothetical protein